MVKVVWPSNLFMDVSHHHFLLTIVIQGCAKGKYIECPSTNSRDFDPGVELYFMLLYPN